jgi:hypothetical protein
MRIDDKLSPQGKSTKGLDSCHVLLLLLPMLEFGDSRVYYSSGKSINQPIRPKKCKCEPSPPTRDTMGNAFKPSCTY